MDLCVDSNLCPLTMTMRDCRGRDRMVYVVVFITTYAMSAYHHYSGEFEPRSWRGVLDTTLCDKVCLWLATSRWFSRGTPVSSTNKSDRHNITEILLKVALRKWHELIITGDFNFHLDDPNDSNSRTFLEILDEHSLSQHMVGATHVRGHTLDVVIARENSQLLHDRPFIFDPILYNDKGDLVRDHMVIRSNLRTP
jgi:hypothetical protein